MSYHDHGKALQTPYTLILVANKLSQKRDPQFLELKSDQQSKMRVFAKFTKFFGVNLGPLYNRFSKI